MKKGILGAILSFIITLLLGILLENLAIVIAIIINILLAFIIKNKSFIIGQAIGFILAIVAVMVLATFIIADTTNDMVKRTCCTDAGGLYRDNKCIGGTFDYDADFYEKCIRN